MANKTTEKLKVIQVNAEVHAQAKVQADREGMLLKKYIQKLIEKDK